MSHARRILKAVDALHDEVDASRYGSGADDGVSKARVGLVKELIAGGCVDKKSGVEFIHGDLIGLSTRPTASGKRHRPRQIRNSGTKYRVAYTVIRSSGHGASHKTWRDLMHSSNLATLAIAERTLKAYKRRGLTAWIETGDGDFVPVKGAMKKPGMGGVRRNCGSCPPRRNLQVHSALRYEVDADSVHKATRSFVELKKKRCLTRRDVDVLAGLLEWSAGVMVGIGVPESIKRRAAELHIAIKDHMAAISCPPARNNRNKKMQMRHHMGIKMPRRNPEDYAHSHHRGAAGHRHATGGWGRNGAKIKPKRIVGGEHAIAYLPGWPVHTWPVSVDDLGGDLWLVTYRSKGPRSPLEYRLVRPSYSSEGKVSRVREIGPGFDSRSDALAHVERHDMVRNPKKGKKMAKKKAKKKSSKKKSGGFRLAYPGGMGGLSVSPGAYRKKKSKKKAAKKKAKKKSSKKKAVKRAAPKRKPAKKKAKKLTAAQKLARKRAASARKAKRTRMAVKASACRVGRVGRKAQGKRPGPCPPKPKLKKGSVGAPMAKRMHRAYGHAVRNFYNLKEDLD